MKPLNSSFFMQYTDHVAEALLGAYLVREIKGVRLIGRIVETEAYLGKEDSCCHSFNSSYTNRTKTMYLRGGHSYVYFTYGMHYCFNVVTRSQKEPEAVLIRALEPVEGLTEMKNHRKKESLTDLCSGPGKLCQAFNITKALNAKNLSEKGELYLSKGQKMKNIEADSRVGLPWYKDSAYWFLRFYVKDNPFVSVKKNQIA